MEIIRTGTPLQWTTRSVARNRCEKEGKENGQCCVSGNKAPFLKRFLNFANQIYSMSGLRFES